MRITKKLIDRLAQLEAQIADLKAEADIIKDEIKARGDGVYAGIEYVVEVATTATATLDQKAIKAILEPAQIIACTKTGSRTNVRVKPRQTAEA